MAKLTLLSATIALNFLQSPEPSIDSIMPASAVLKRMTTRPKNATQHPGYILTGGKD
jgi:hypothetical protein